MWGRQDVPVLNKLIYIKCLSVVFVLIIAGCSSREAELWPVIEADPLWQEIKKNQKNPAVPEEFLTEDSQPDLIEDAHSLPVLKNLKSSELLKAEMKRHWRGFDEDEQQFLMALKKYDQQKTPQNWLAIELYKSRIKDRNGELRGIEAQASRQSYLAVLKDVKQLLKKVTELQAKIPASIHIYEQEK